MAPIAPIDDPNQMFSKLYGRLKDRESLASILDDLREDLKKIDVPTLVLHGDDDQIVPIDDSGKLTAQIVKNATLKVYPGGAHGMCTIEADKVNADLLAFLRTAS